MKTKRFARLKLFPALVLMGIASLTWLAEKHTSGQQRSESVASRARIDFNRDIRPILADKCWACHGPDAPNKKIRLRLDSEAAAKADLGGRRAIVANQPDQSELVRRIHSTEKFEQMPPPASGRSLSDTEKQLLTEWIRQGAQWQQHWAFIAPVRPALPAVKNKAWIRNPIDAFVLARLEREQLQPAPEADRSTLLRRLSFDLTGLPPTARELDEFLNDPSPNTYEKVVDRLLASPRFGERMAFRWLDAARYADTNGYQIDGERSAWRWRDWVINAYNRNLPFDQFVIEQLAGDLLPDPTLDQRIATAFNRNHRTNAEDGIVPEEYRIEYIVDRVDTVSTVFLGLTMGCARCHNHKYDPLSQKEYYQFSAYFNSIPEDGRASNYGNSAPWIAAPTTEQQRQHTAFRQQIARTENQLMRLARRDALLRHRWERALSATAIRQWFPNDNLLVRHSLDESSALEIKGTLARINLARPDDVIVDRKPEKKDEVGFKNGAPKFVSSPTGQAVSFDGKIYFDAGKTANFDYRDRLRDYKDNFAVSAWFYPANEQSGAIVTHMRDEAGEQENNLPKNRGWGLFFNHGKIHFNLTSVWADDSYRIETADRVPLQQWHHVTAIFDSTQPLHKVRIYLNGREQKLIVNNGRIFRSFGDASVTLKIGAGGGSQWRFRGSIDEVRIYKAIPDPDQLAVLACADSLAQIAAIPERQRSRAQQLKMLGAFFDEAAPADARQLWQQLSTLKLQKLNLEAEFPTLMVMEETSEPRPAFVLRRGAYDLPGEQVARALPAVLPALPAHLPNNRLGFARWLTSPDHPLTARVQVNRFWQMLFGTGLVKTVEDFGSQGELPSHPELLDWLAIEFATGGQGDAATRRRGDTATTRNGQRATGNGQNHNPQSAVRNPQSTGWNVKALLKLIVMSATYRQSSIASTDATMKDPENRLLARASRFRLSPEMIRDQALFVSGLLVEKPGGASVKTYQPPGLWNDMTFSNMTVYDQEKGDGLWRRSLYTYWKRTILNPTMLVFDASAREHCTVRETRTNTPLQALNLMNDVTYVEAARMLAQRLLLEGGQEAQQRLTWAFRQALSREPKHEEIAVLRKSLDAQLAWFTRQPEDAARVLSLGMKRNANSLNQTELAAYTMIASLILNLDETITRQ